jgi:hypothetical protein
MAPQLPLSFRIAILNPEVGSMRALWLLCAVGAAGAQSLTVQTPEVSVYEGARPWSHFLGKYLPAPLSHTVFSNSGRLDSLMRAGNVYLSLADAIALALENNLDIEYHRYDRRQAETDQLRASAGQLLRFSGGGIRAGCKAAFSAGSAFRRREAAFPTSSRWLS